MNLNEWTTIGPTEQKIYPSGDLFIVRRITDGWTAEKILASGTHDGYPLGFLHGMTCAAVKTALDAKFDPQPVAARFETVSVFTLGGKEAVVLKSWSPDEWYRRNSGKPGSRTRDEAERETIDWLKQQVLAKS